MTTPWTFSALWHRHAVLRPERIAFVHGDRTLTWKQFDEQSATVAGAMATAGIGAHDVVALCMRNSPDYLIAFSAALRIGATPANVNYRYRATELDELLTLLDPRALIFSHDIIPELAHFRGLFHRVRIRIQSGDEDPVRWAVSLQDLLACSPGPEPVRPCAAATIIKCTGGTTGRPAAVRWNATELFAHLNRRNPWVRHDVTTDLAEATPAAVDVGVVAVPPLVHGTALTRALGALNAGGTVITLPSRGFAPADALDAVQDNSANTMVIVGDVHARPLLRQVHEHSHRWTLESLRVVASSGAAWTAPVKTAFLAEFPHLELVETLGATEATGLGQSVARPGDIPQTGVFHLGEHAAVVRADGTVASTGEVGRIGVSYPHPTGLHPDAPLPSERFVEAAATTYLLSGDHAQLLDGGRFKHLGRDEDCINTGGEKVYAPEVAEILAAHPAVRDVTVFAAPDRLFGNTVAALIVPQGRADLDQILDHARRLLASYKIPARCRLVDRIPRTLAGKIDLPSARALIASVSMRSTVVASEPTDRTQRRSATAGRADEQGPSRR